MYYYHFQLGLKKHVAYLANSKEEALEKLKKSVDYTCAIISNDFQIEFSHKS